MKHTFLFLYIVVIGWFAAGCASDQPPPTTRYVDPSSHGTVSGLGIESQDLVAATDKMTRKLLDTSQLQAGNEPATIALLPVENRTRFAIDKEIFTTRLKALLNEKGRTHFRFVARDRMEAIKKEKDLKEKGEVTGSAARKPLGVDYYLTGELSGLSTATQEGKSDYMLFTFRLIDAGTAEEIWEGSYELKKEGTEDAIYR